jgi:hypothetical protein
VIPPRETVIDDDNIFDDDDDGGDGQPQSSHGNNPTEAEAGDDDDDCPNFAEQSMTLESYMEEFFKKKYENHNAESDDKSPEAVDPQVGRSVSSFLISLLRRVLMESHLDQASVISTELIRLFDSNWNISPLAHLLMPKLDQTVPEVPSLPLPS